VTASNAGGSSGNSNEVGATPEPNLSVIYNGNGAKPTLAEVTKHQSEFQFVEVKGTLFGFYTPTFAQTINVPGFHFHFITEDKTSGGHVLNVRFDSAKV
jgi:alpha-acetolactate decarboxylase